MITDDDIEKALDYMRDHAEDCAKWKAERVYVTEYRKTLKAELMRQSNGKTAADREEFAYSHEDYKNHLEAIKEAVYQDEKHRFMILAAQAKIEAWRTEMANQRALGTFT